MRQYIVAKEMLSCSWDSSTTVAVANRWGEQAALLHLRSHLEGTARACGARQHSRKSGGCPKGQIWVVPAPSYRIDSYI